MLKLRDAIYFEELDDAAVLLDTMSERVTVLADEEKNILNALICKQFEDVVEEMFKKYDGEKEIIEQDIRKFIEKLKENGFVEDAEE